MLRPLHILALILCATALAACSAGQEYRTVLTTDPNYIAAQEVKLKVRELADQLLAGIPNDALEGFVALPTSFVDQNDFASSSPLGRYLTEGLTYEFNQRGFPVREYRTDGVITMRDDTGETTLERKGKLATAKGRHNALILGTYHQDPDAIFVNARLVRSSDGIVMRTGQIMLAPNAVTLRMTNAAPDGRPERVWREEKRQAEERQRAAEEKKLAEELEKKRRQVQYPEPGPGPLYAYTPAAKSGGMKIRQAPPRRTGTEPSTAGGLMGYVPE
jgi:hypothetical protein